MIPSRLAAAAAALLCSLFAACSSAEPPPQPPQAPRLVVELQRWEVIDGGRPIGVIKQLEIRDPSGPLAYYRIEDLDGRWRGHASDGLRFSRRVPFQEEEQDVGVWSLARGAAVLLDARGTVELKPVVREADARRESSEPR